MTNSLLSKSRPWCIGRFIFDRPTASKISNQRYDFRGERLTTQYNVSSATYQAEIAAREKDLRTKQRVNPVNLKEKPVAHGWRRSFRRRPIPGFLYLKMPWQRLKNFLLKLRVTFSLMKN
ncbi:hypothetical protein [Burkholderia ambifaria]|uniref:hypothetical protein n=1 Tax=Burkholderia ambifaria TaxID=152480 RepID=UPI0031FD34ED